jgi:hypothetical protein
MSKPNELVKISEVVSALEIPKLGVVMYVAGAAAYVPGAVIIDQVLDTKTGELVPCPPWIGSASLKPYKQPHFEGQAQSGGQVTGPPGHIA